jgi:hypothetical protein
MPHDRPLRFAVLCVSLLALSLVSSGERLEAAVGDAASPRPQQETLLRLVATQLCPCGCGSHLPGSTKSPACFGCSVGKAEVSFIRESLAAGRAPGQILLDLQDPVLVEVFADYDDPDLRQTWERAQRAADAFDLHRVVMRTPARSPAARRALALAECARAANRFTPLQQALIRHPGPWDEDALVRIAVEQGLPGDPTRACLQRIDLTGQVAKDRDHAAERGIRSFPTITVNRRVTPATDSALGEAIRRVLLAESL